MTDDKVYNDIGQRRGNIVVNRTTLKEYVSCYDNSNPIFKDFVPVDVKYDFATDTMRISGYSPHFKHISDSQEAPDYEVLVTRRVKQENVVTVHYQQVVRS